MTADLLAVALVVVVALLVADRVRARRHPNPDIQALIALADRLCQRIQAPHAAILEHDERARERRDEEYAPPAVQPDVDDDYWAARDKLAETLMQQETNGDS